MAKQDPRIDAYIEKAAPFAQPILRHLRGLVHQASPKVEETIKWGMPHFEYKGLLCGMAAFKAHCTLGFWKGALILPADDKGERAGMGHFGKITDLSDLPSEKILVGYIKKAVALNEAGTKVPERANPSPKPPLAVPPDLADGLRGNVKARKHFEALSPSQRKEYIVWITEAKRAETREKRLATTLEWLAEGKSRNWKYENC